MTGGSSGIGRAMARLYAINGATVWAVARREEPLHRLRRGTPAVETVSADLTTGEGRQRVVEAVGRSTDTLDVALHAAGLLGPPGVPLEEYPSQAWYEVFEANVSAVHLLHQAMAPLMHASSSPTVIGMSSTVGRRGRAGWGMYAVSKFALEGWLETLADEWSEAGHVYSVNPGGTATPMRAAARPDEDPSTIPTPEDISPIFLRLAHEACPEPSGSKFEARDWIDRDPWAGVLATPDSASNHQNPQSDAGPNRNQKA